MQQPAKTSLPLPLFPSVSARLVPKVRQDHAKISHQLQTPGAEQRNCGKPQPPTEALLSASPPPRVSGRDRGFGPGRGLDPLGRLRGGWMEDGWRLDGAWSPSGPVGVRLAVRRGQRRQGPADCRVLVSTCCCSLQAELPNPARRHGRLLGNLPGSSAYRHSPQLGRGAGRERLQKIEQ